MSEDAHDTPDWSDHANWADDSPDAGGPISCPTCGGHRVLTWPAKDLSHAESEACTACDGQGLVKPTMTSNGIILVPHYPTT